MESKDTKLNISITRQGEKIELNPEVVFSDPRLNMSFTGRSLVRILRYIFYISFIFLTFIFLISNIHSLRYLGVLFSLIIIDFLLHKNDGDIQLIKLLALKKANIARSIRPKAFSVIERSFDRSIITKENIYLVIARELFYYSQIREGLSRIDIDPKEFKNKIEELISKEKDSIVGSSKDFYKEKIFNLLVESITYALNSGHEYIEISDLFSALSNIKDDSISRLFSIFSIDKGDLERALILGRIKSGIFTKFPRALGGFTLEHRRKIKHRIMNRAWTARPTPTLDNYSIDLTDLARDNEIGFLIGHDEEYQRLVETLARPTNPNVILIGEAGIGKETIINHFAERLANDDVPKQLFDKRLVNLRLESLVSGADQNELANRIKKIVEEIYFAENIILYIPDIHNLLRTSGEAYLSAADILMPVILDSAFPVIGTTYPKEYKNLIESRSDFVGSFEMISVNEISEEDAQKILSYESLILEKKTRITITFGAIKQAVFLAKKYFRKEFLPSSAEELLKSALVDAERHGEKILKPDIVNKIAEIKTKIPLHEAKGGEAYSLLHMEDIIHEKLIDQEEAVTAVAQALRAYRSGVMKRGGTIASFLFVGPTGVGKTELAKALARIQFGSENAMVRFDMTEYQDKQSFIRFIGSPDGATRGLLTDAVISKPYCLILLDEFEKAFPDILNLFLQVFDDGRLTNNLGEVVDFSNTIIIATSNAHSDIINESLSKGESMSDIADYLKRRLVDVFKAELLNRFSKIIVFKNLSVDDLNKIARLNLNELSETLKQQGIIIDYSDEAVEKVVKLGYDPSFGARPLQRVIDDNIRSKLSEDIISGKIAKGSKIKLVLNGENFDFIEE